MHWRKAKGTLSALKQGECYQWKAKGKCTSGDACSFRHALNPSCSTTADGKILRKESLSEPESVWEEISKTVQRFPFWDMYEPPRMISGTLQYVRITKTQSGSRFSEKCALMHREVVSQRNNRPTMNDGKGSVALLKNSKQSGCVSWCIERPKSNPILLRGTKSLGPKRSVQFSKGAPRHVKIRERKGPWQGVIQHTGSNDGSPTLRNLKTDLRKQP